MPPDGYKMRIFCLNSCVKFHTKTARIAEIATKVTGVLLFMLTS